MDPARVVLREHLSAAHMRVDAAFSQYNLTELDGFGGFLSAHAAAFRTVQGVVGTCDLIDYKSLLGLLEHDLSVLGRDVPELSQCSASYDSINALGAAYVVAGSHFGKKVLSQRWSKSTDPRVLRASRFIMTDILREAWPAVMSQLSKQYGSVNFEASLRAARATFAVFEDIALAQNDRAHSQSSNPQAKHAFASGSPLPQLA